MFELSRLLKLNPFRAKIAAFHDFERLLNWRLLRGSHLFPGPDGGTCINEAAIITAGHPYRPVRAIDDCPVSFSRSIATYALFLNDLIEGDDLRSRVLMPFVTRLDGSADSAESEKRRAELMVLRTASAILAPALLRHGWFEASERLRTIRTLGGAIDVVREVLASSKKAPFFPPSWMSQALSDIADGAHACLHGDFTEAAKNAAIVAATVAQGMQRTSRRNGRRVLTRIYREAGNILDAALEIGSRGKVIGGAEAVARLEKAKRKLMPIGFLPV